MNGSRMRIGAPARYGASFRWWRRTGWATQPPGGARRGPVIARERASGCPYRRRNAVRVPMRDTGAEALAEGPARLGQVSAACPGGTDTNVWSLSSVPRRHPCERSVTFQRAAEALMRTRRHLPACRGVTNTNASVPFQRAGDAPIRACRSLPSVPRRHRTNVSVTRRSAWIPPTRTP
jgi:hypothetical protein